MIVAYKTATVISFEAVENATFNAADAAYVFSSQDATADAYVFAYDNAVNEKALDSELSDTACLEALRRAFDFINKVKDTKEAKNNIAFINAYKTLHEILDARQIMG